MATLRCYLPLSPDQVEQLHTDRRLDGPLEAYVVTQDIRAARAGADDEAWEFDALQAAARSLQEAGAPVIVAAADPGEQQVDLGAGANPVRLAELDLPRVAALHVGDDVVTGEPGQVIVSEGAIELSWYDTTEIAQVIELAREVGAR